MKKTLALLLVALAVVAAGCGGGDDKEAATTAAGETSNGDFKVGLVTDLGGLNDRGFNALAYKGLKRAGKELGIPTRVVQSRSTQE